MTINRKLTQLNYRYVVKKITLKYNIVNESFQIKKKGGGGYIQPIYLPENLCYTDITRSEINWVSLGEWIYGTEAFYL